MAKSILEKRNERAAKRPPIGDPNDPKTPVLWIGELKSNKLFAPLKFYGPENEYEAREMYLQLNGITATTDKVLLKRLK